MYDGKVIALALSTAIVIALGYCSTSIVESLDADELMVIQAPWSGELVWHSSPGIKMQYFGKVTKYPRRSVYDFVIPVRFNDGGHGTMTGSIQYEMPTDQTILAQLHQRFGSPDAVQKQLIETVVNKSVYMTGPLMSSKESYAEKRNALIHYVEDQVVAGVYKTVQREARTRDPITGAEKTTTIVEIVVDKDGAPARQEEAVLRTFGLKTFNFSITKLDYDEQVENQIKKQQELAMAVQTQMAEAKQAEQQAITAAEKGKANTATAQWEQEVVKVKALKEAEQKYAVAEKEAQQKLAVARLDAEQTVARATAEAKAAEQYKISQLQKAEGDAEYKKRVMLADGALAQKLDAYVKVNQAYAEALKAHQGPLFPHLMMGGPGMTNSPAGGAPQLIDLLSAKAAQDLSLELKVQGSIPSLPRQEISAKPVSATN